MAIQVGGNTVINNSRQLQNITSLDSGTTTVIASAVGGGVNVQEFTSSGTWSKPSSGTFAMITCIAGGGGGGAMSANIAGGGGEGGQHAVKFILLSNLGSTVTVTIGAGGAGAPNQSTAGGLGGDTTFGDFVISLGGLGGDSYNGAFIYPSTGTRTSFAANSYGSYLAGNSNLTAMNQTTGYLINDPDSISVTAERNRTSSSQPKRFTGNVYGRSGGSAVSGDTTDQDAVGYGAGGGSGFQITTGGDGSAGYCSVIVF